MRNYKWDLFICHASEEKETLVRPLAENLSALGLKVWYDEFTLRVGNSLLRSVDRGLAESRFGLVIISKSFFKKEFPQHELRGLATRQLHEGREVILPIWHGVSKEDVLAFSPPLADLIAIRTADTPAEDIGLEILLKVRPDIYEQHERSDLLKLYKRKPLHELHQELMQLQESLSQYQCPYCGALMEEHSVFDDGEHATDIRVFACGLRTESGLVEEMCPNVTDVPKFGEFEIEYTHYGSSWTAIGIPRTLMARPFGELNPLFMRSRASKEEALQILYETYLRQFKHQEWRDLATKIGRTC
jgi:TIR domain